MKGKIGTGGLTFLGINHKNGYYLGLHNKEGNIASTATNIIHHSQHGIITPLQAYDIDLKMDDGMAKTGKVYGAYTAGDTLTYYDGYGWTTSCISGTAYNFSVTTNDCRLFVEGRW